MPTPARILARGGAVPELYHYTCEHSFAALGIGTVTLYPGGSPEAAERNKDKGIWASRLVWATDLAIPDRAALGLTSYILDCDRMSYRYRIVSPEVMVPWHVLARLLTREMREEIESQPGSRPMHWWVTGAPIEAEYAPMIRSVKSG